MDVPSVIPVASAFPPGTVLGKYEIVRLVGAGGMSAVYEGRHVDLGRRVAIKTLKPERAVQPSVRALPAGGDRGVEDTAPQRRGRGRRR